MPSASAIAELDQLAQVCDPGTKVVVVGSTNDIMLYRELMRRGAMAEMFCATDSSRNTPASLRSSLR